MTPQGDHFAGVRDVVAETFGVDPAGLTVDSSPGSVAGWDSMGHLRLVMAVESRFGVRFQTDEIGRMKTIDDICRRIAERQG